LKSPKGRGRVKGREIERVLNAEGRVRPLLHPCNNKVGLTLRECAEYVLLGELLARG